MKPRTLWIRPANQPFSFDVQTMARWRGVIVQQTKHISPAASLSITAARHQRCASPLFDSYQKSSKLFNTYAGDMLLFDKNHWEKRCRYSAS